MNFQEYAIEQHMYIARMNSKLQQILKLHDIVELERDINKKNRIIGRVKKLETGVKKYQHKLTVLQNRNPVYADMFTVYPKKEEE